MLLNSYLDTAGVWTIGFGHAATNIRNVRGLKDGAYYDGPVVEGVTITRAEALRLFESDIGDFEVAVSRGLNLPPGVELAQCQYDALCDHAFQFGSHNLLSSTLLMQVNANPNNLGSDEAHGIAWEFSRWNKVGGVPSEAIYRRSLRRAFSYAGQPVPAKLWSKGGIPWALDAAGHIDWTVTPTVYKVMADAKKAATKPTFEPEYPRKAEPAVIPTIETPAADISPPANVEAAPVIQPPSPPERPTDSDDTGTTVRADSGAEREPAPSSVKVPAPTLPPVVKPAPKPVDVPKSPPPVIAGQDGAKPKSPMTVNPDSVPYRIDPNAGLKPMESTDRYKASISQNTGMVLIRMARYGAFGGGAKTISDVVERDAVFMQTFVMFAGIAGVWLFGEGVKCYGNWKRRRAEDAASQAMY